MASGRAEAHGSVLSVGTAFGSGKGGEAIASDRAADAKRKREEREAKRLATPPPPLPAGAPPSLNPVSDPAETALGALAGDTVDPVLRWSAEDFRTAAPELVELCEAWRVDSHTKHAAGGKLPKIVVQEIARDAAFPPGSKKSLSTSSCVTLANMFNALHVPILIKSVVSTIPALAYIVVRDLQTSSRIEKLIAENAETQKSDNQQKS